MKPDGGIPGEGDGDPTPARVPGTIRSRRWHTPPDYQTNLGKDFRRDLLGGVKGPIHGRKSRGDLDLDHRQIVIDCGDRSRREEQARQKAHRNLTGECARMNFCYSPELRSNAMVA